MREYELTLIIQADLEDSASDEIVNRVSGWITDSGGQITKTDNWGKRQLAYPIRKQMEGRYVLMHIRIDGKFGAELERNLRFLEPVLRFMLIAK